MSELRDLRSIVEAAEQAASASDYASAERHLRSAIAVQEATLGLHHPDLANTLNNLGVVCERTGNTAEAERAYRQAYAVARAAFDAEHPFVVTSAANLREFCETFGRPFDLPAPPAPTPMPTPPPSRVAPPSSKPSSSPISFRVLAVLAVAGLGLVWLILYGPLRTPRKPAPIEPSATSATADGPASAKATAPAPPGATESKAVESPRLPSAAPPGNPAARGAHGPAAAATSVDVARAHVCRDLSTRASNSPDWPCDPVRGSAPTGTLFFYTRLLAAKPTMVLHRWYRGGVLQQEVKLHVNANPGAGYRTYSRLTIGAERAGDWRVELRTADGVLLHKESFAVR